MSRNYSQKFLIEMYKADPKNLGNALARACVAANLPAKYVATVLGVTRMTIYGWFRGKPFRRKNKEMTEAFMRLVEKDIDVGRLPAKSVADAKTYLEDMIGEKIA